MAGLKFQYLVLSIMNVIDSITKEFSNGWWTFSHSLEETQEFNLGFAIHSLGNFESVIACIIFPINT